MTNEIKKIISDADRGDKCAQKQLMSMAQEKMDAGEFKEASELFKSAAIACRIAASRSYTLIEEEKDRNAWLQKLIQIYQDWINDYASPVAPRIKCLIDLLDQEQQNNVAKPKGSVIEQHENIDIRRCIHNALDKIITSHEDKYRKYQILIWYLNEKLMKYNISPIVAENTTNTAFISFVSEQNDYKEYTQDIEIRVALDPLSDELINRCLETKK